jgi:exopolyphosphatase/guanosine-5'-triphosphate,3'-diphosphate pyrophosphatase
MTTRSRLACRASTPRRADLSVAGAVLLDTILQRLGADDLTLCDLALREGLVLDYIRRHQKEIVHIEQIP